MRMQLFSLPFIIQILLIFITTIKVAAQCRSDQQSSLIQLKNELTFNSSLSSKLPTWNQTTDCCQWLGIGCDLNGRVIVLDLNGEMISGGINQTSSLFSLQFLQRLNLANNRFNSAQIPSGVGNLIELRYLNLSSCGLTGQIPIELSRLTRLVVLDLSSLYFAGLESLKLENPNLMMFVRNMTVLKELYLDGVNISASGNEWGQAISSSLPNLEVLSMSNCYLAGPIDHSLMNLTFLSIIRLDQNNLSTNVPDFIADFRNLTVLRLSSCNLNGTFPEKILKAPTLQILDLTTNAKLHGSLPEFPDNGSLQNLKLSYTNISGQLPNSTGKLMNLSRIELSNCNFSGDIPTSMGKLAKLVYLDLSWNSFSGPIPSFQICKNLTYMDLSQNSLSGSVPSSYFDGLEKLVNIDWRNNLFNGTVPTSLFSIPSLQKIQLSNNQFGDQITEFFNPNSSLDTLDLSNNNVQGPIPNSFFQFRSLNVLSLSYNNFSGHLKLEEMATNFPNLTRLELSCNNLSIDANFSNDSFPMLTVLKLASSKLNQFPNLRNRSRINILDLSDNEIDGEIPNWLWNVSSLRQLNLSANFLVGMQKPYAISTSLSILDLHLNKLSGEIPIVPASIIYLDCSSNNLESSLPDEIGNSLLFANFFSLARNRLSGVIPMSICNATNLMVLDLFTNEFNGSIPSCLIEKNSMSLGVLNLGNNRLTGSITGNFPEKCVLKTLDLNGNLLEGKVPISLANCKDLEVLNLGNNKMIDNYPCFLKNSSSLRVLVLRRNNFHGNISCYHTGVTNTTWEKLQIVDLALNNFTGIIPAKCFSSWKGMANSVDGEKTDLDHLRFEFMKLNRFYYQDTVTVTNKGLQMELVKILTVFTSVDFSGNQLEGEIPSTVGDMKALYVLNLSHNALTGQIPSVIGNLTQLGSLDLSNNSLSGNIPLQLLDLTFLSVLNLSYNKLTGMIPYSRQFLTFSETSFLGNPGLCGIVLNVSCSTKLSPSNNTSDKRSFLRIRFDWQFIFTGMGFGIGSGLIVGVLFFCKPTSRWCDKHVEKFAMFIIACLGLKKKSEKCFEEMLYDDHDETDDSDEDIQDGEISERRYCIFCTRLDSNRKNVIHNPQCCCHDKRTSVYSFSSSTTSSS
ncbi:receptor-like protein 7 [Impatiens glandulifera]|uniref:receptor-like protein 7 n=1 Tax=Impatiens glandulifera TaxID=253017 RepID=UPI001FB08E08|nr:receptor-like protein 7 [Impatiens glandulifera]